MRQLPLAVRLEVTIRIVEVELDVAVVNHLVSRVGGEGGDLADGPGKGSAGARDTGDHYGGGGGKIGSRWINGG